MLTLLVILIILVGVPCLKWILIILAYPFQAAYCSFKKKRTGLLKVLGAPYWLLERLFRGGWQRFSLFHIGTLPSRHLRKWLYEGLGAECGHRSVFHFRTEIRDPWRLKVGEGSIIGDNALLDARNGLTIGQNVNLSSNVSIYTQQHDHSDPYFGCKTGRQSVEIGDRVWLGSHVIVLPGVRIGEGAVCCSGCVVTKDIEPFTIVAGVPAKKIGERERDLKYTFDGKGCRIY